MKQRIAGAVDEAGQHIAAHRIGAEEVFRAAAAGPTRAATAARRCVLDVGRMRGDPRREQRNQHQQQEHHEADARRRELTEK